MKRSLLLFGTNLPIAQRIEKLDRSQRPSWVPLLNIESFAIGAN